MKYQYHDLSESQFEELVVAICWELLGTGVQGFTSGRDGGRDARFHGKAQNYPSQSDLWNGIIVVQAKHTNAINEKFSEPNFFINQSSVINEEIPKIKKLFDEKCLDYYMLFSNRKLPAQANEDILNHLSIRTGVEKRNIALFGIERVEDFLKWYPNIKDRVNLNPFEYPLMLEPDDLANIIIAFNKNKELLRNVSPLQEFEEIKEIKRINFENKNNKNNLSDEYAKIIEEHMITHFDDITSFLSTIANNDYKVMYDDIVTEFNMGIMAYKNDFDCFDRVLNYIYNLLIGRDNDLKRNKTLTRIFIHYMYYFCDIGSE